MILAKTLGHHVKHPANGDFTLAFLTGQFEIHCAGQSRRFVMKKPVDCYATSFS